MTYRIAALLRISILTWIMSLSMIMIMGFYTSQVMVNYNTFNYYQLDAVYSEWQTIAAHPWLTFNHSYKAPFSMLYNDLDRLLLFMSNKARKIALVRFSYPWQIMLQNQIYTLVKFAQVYNYIVMVGDEKSLEVCLQLNLPCYNGTKYYKNYYKDVDPTVDASYFDKEHYRPINWFKLRFYRDVLMKNYTILAFDTDIAFSRKNIWLSFEKYSADVGNCDMIFMEENPINAGLFYSRSNPSTITLLNKWVDTERTHWHLDEQKSFGQMRSYYYEICNTTKDCNTIKHRRMINMDTELKQSFEMSLVTVRTFRPAYYPYGTGVCPSIQNIDPCLDTTVFLHAICRVGQVSKIDTLKTNGFWMLEEHCKKQALQSSIKHNDDMTLNIYRCEPLVFKNSNAEKEFEKCTNEIAWTTQSSKEHV